jgi:hypothetical protein
LQIPPALWVLGSSCPRGFCFAAAAWPRPAASCAKRPVRQAQRPTPADRGRPIQRAAARERSGHAGRGSAERCGFAGRMAAQRQGAPREARNRDDEADRPPPGWQQRALFARAVRRGPSHGRERSAFCRDARFSRPGKCCDEQQPLYERRAARAGISRRALRLSRAWSTRNVLCDARGARTCLV